MCRPALVWVAGTCAGLAFASVAATAQESPEVTRLAGRLDSLLARAGALDPRVDVERERFDAATRETWEEPVVIDAGGLRVRVLPRDAEAARALFTDTWDVVFRPVLGEPRSEVTIEPVGYYDHRGEWNPRVGEGQRWGWSVEVHTALDDREGAAVRALGHASISEGPRSLAAWFDEVDRNAGFDPRVDWLMVRRQLASARSRSVRGCVDGGLDACLVSLGLRPEGASHADVVRGWYSTDELLRWWRIAYRTHARATPGEDLDPESMFLYDSPELRMRPDGDGTPGRLVIPAGVRILHGAGPTTARTRASVLVVALDLGGEAAFDRLLALPEAASLEHTLAVVADRPVPEIVAEWRARVMGPSRTRDAGSSAAALAWVGLLAAFSMTSTRWRWGR